MKKRANYGIVPICILAFLPIGSSASRQKASPLPSVSVIPFVIEPQAFPGAEKNPNETVVLRELSNQATNQAQSTLLKKKIALTVNVNEKAEAATPVVITGVVRLPVSLPPDLIGLQAVSRRGRFATATVSVRNGTGKVVAEQTVQLVWGDATWTRGMRIKRNLPLDKVLADFVRKAADRAIQRLDFTKLTRESLGRNMNP